MQVTSNSDERERIERLGSTCVCKNLRRAARLVTNYYDEILAPTGLRVSQLTLLVVLYRAGPQTIHELAEKLAVDRTTLTRNLRPLAENGLLTVAPGGDQRTRIVRLTAEGEAHLVDALPLWEEAQAHMIEGLGQTRVTMLLRELSDTAGLAQDN